MNSKRNNLILISVALSVLLICPVSAALLSKPEGCHFIRGDEMNDKGLSDLLLRVKELEHARSAFILKEETSICGVIATDIAEIDSERNYTLGKISQVCSEKVNNFAENRTIALSRLQEVSSALRKSQLELRTTVLDQENLHKAKLNNANLSHAVTYWKRINDCINRK